LNSDAGHLYSAAVRVWDEEVAASYVVQQPCSVPTLIGTVRVSKFLVRERARDKDENGRTIFRPDLLELSVDFSLDWVSTYKKISKIVGVGNEGWNQRTTDSKERAIVGFSNKIFGTVYAIGLVSIIGSSRSEVLKPIPLDVY
jgi:hypothetical protein